MKKEVGTMKKMMVGLLIGMILVVPAQADTSIPEIIENCDSITSDNYFVLPDEEFLNFIGVRKFDLSEEWFPFEGLYLRDSDTGYLSSIIPETQEKIDIYIAGQDESLGTLNDIFVGLTTNKDRNSDSIIVSRDVDMSKDGHKATKYVYLSADNTVYVNYSANAGTHIIDIVYSRPSSSEDKYGDELSKAMDEIEFLDSPEQ